MLDILKNITTGKGKNGDLEELEKLAEWTKKGSLCGLGKTAPNPVSEYIEIFQGRIRSAYQRRLSDREMYEYDHLFCE